MLRDHYQYALELERLDHTALGQFPVVMDWGPACEWARFITLRENGDEAKPRHGDATVEPNWHDSRGEPFVGGVRVSLGGNGSAHPSAIRRFGR